MGGFLALILLLVDLDGRAWPAATVATVALGLHDLMEAGREELLEELLSLPLIAEVRYPEYFRVDSSYP